MKYSVVIPAYNDAEVLAKCLDCLYAQNFKDRFELIVVDDGSTDGTGDLLYEWEKREDLPFDLITLSEENSGAAVARNLGVSRASGEVILFIGADILVSEGWLGEHAKFHEEHPEEGAMAVGFMTWTPELADDRFRRWLEGSGLALSFKGCRNYCETDFWHFFTGNVSLKRSFFERYRFDEDFKGYGWEDIMLGYRLLGDEGKLFYLKDALAWHDHKLEESDYFPDRMREIGGSAVLFAEKFPKVPLLPRGLKLWMFKVLGRTAGFWSFWRREWGWYALSKRYFLEGVRKARARDLVLILGSYGAGNIGDEAMLDVILRNFPLDFRPAVLSGNVEDTRRRHKNVSDVAMHLPFGLRSFLSFRWLKSLRLLRKSKVVIVGGGGLFTDSYSPKAVYLWAWHIYWARVFRKPVVLFANSFGPVKGFFAKRVARRALSKCSALMLRDEISAEAVRKLLPEADVSVGFDPVILFAQSLGHAERRKKIALNFRDVKEDMQQYWQFVEYCKSLNYEVVLVAMEPADAVLMPECLQPRDLSELINVLRDCDLLVGMRLHFLLAGVLAGCRVAGIAYNLKVAGILRKLDLPFVELGKVDSLTLKNLPDEAVLAGHVEAACDDARKMFKQLSKILEKLA